TIVGNASWVPGKLGGALDLDGQAYVDAGNAQNLKLVGDLTIAFWMNKKSPAGDWQRRVGKGDEKLRNYGCWAAGDGDTVLFQQFNDAYQAVVNITSQREMQIGKWHHFAATVKGTQAILYLDGVKDGEAARTGTPATSDHPLL